MIIASFINMHPHIPSRMISEIKPVIAITVMMSNLVIVEIKKFCILNITTYDYI